jgi:hypothetical protein
VSTPGRSPVSKKLSHKYSKFPFQNSQELRVLKQKALQFRKEYVLSKQIYVQNQETEQRLRKDTKNLLTSSFDSARDQTLSQHSTKGAQPASLTPQNLTLDITQSQTSRHLRHLNQPHGRPQNQAAISQKQQQQATKYYLDKHFSPKERKTGGNYLSPDAGPGKQV